jgi:hypothetical protein
MGHFSSDRGGHGEGEPNKITRHTAGVPAVNVAEFGAGPSRTPKENSAAIAAAILALPVAGGDLIFPESFSYDETLVLTDGMRALGVGAQQRWRTLKSGTRLNYTGTGQAVHIFNAAEGTREAVEIHNIRFDGVGLSGAIDGLFIDGTAGSAIHYVEGVYLFGAAFTNFPRYQVLADGLLIDIILEHCALNNVEAPSANDLYHGQHTGEPSKIITQLSFNECLLAQYGENAWACNSTCVDTRFNGGTVTTNGQAGGSGIKSGPLTLMGTHVEGIAKAAGSVGIQYQGSNPGNIQPSYCAAWAIGVQIGNPAEAAEKTSGAFIAGMVGGNTVDIRITHGGIRAHTIIAATGEAAGTPPVVEDERFSVDGVHEVVRLDRGPVAKPAENPKAIIEALEQLGLVT